ncbi:hypothetical protein ACOMHN_030993 [Nucella lapillus]
MAEEFGFELAHLPLGFDVEPVDDGGLFFDVFMDEEKQKTVENSPFHGSDSGVSDVSGQSPFPNSLNMDIPLLEEIMCGTGPFLHGDESDKFPSLDEDLVTYLEEGESCNKQTDDFSVVNTPDFSEAMTTRDPHTFNKQKTRSWSTAVGKKLVPQCSASHSFQTTSDGTGFVDTPTSRSQAGKILNLCGSESKKGNTNGNIGTAVNDVSSSRKPKGSIIVKEVGERLPSNSDKSKVTSIKVLRIVKSGRESSTEIDIAKALEERNRKNAEMARQNRLKKKEYVGNLEQEMEDGKKRIGQLESALNSAEEERDSYKREVDYLKAVLANQSALAGLLKNIPSVSGVTLSSSLCRKRVAELDHSYTPVKKARHAGPVQSSGSGVCLHVDNDNVSLEFCHHCAHMAKGGSSS